MFGHDEQRALRADVQQLFGVVGILVIGGLVFIYSASSFYAFERTASSAFFVKKQLIGVVIGAFLLWAASVFPVAWLKRIAPYGFWAALLLTLLTLVPGIGERIHGSSRWLSLGFVTIQPSELLKAAFVLYSAYLLDRGSALRSWVSVGWLLSLAVVLSAGVLLKQPDFGALVTLIVPLFCMLFVAQCRMRYLMGAVAVVVPILIGLVYYKPYRFKRILTFLDPWRDPQGAGFQVIQSLIAIGSGGVYGVGISHSKQKFLYLPMQHTDFIFSIIAEETGFIGSFVIIALFMLFVHRGMRIASKLEDPFVAYTVFGYTALIGVQALINIGVVSGLFPTKGIGLPFVSYGNSSMVVCLAMVGIIVGGVRSALHNPVGYRSRETRIV